jgi:four helix bundle protein
MNGQRNPILRITQELGIAVESYCEQLREIHRYEVANQLLRSATSVGANVHEAQHAESRADFIHKMKIAAKELSETRFWVTHCEASTVLPKPKDLWPPINEAERVINAILFTSIRNRKGHNRYKGK